MKILFLTTSNLAANPRLYKEIILAKENGHQVEVICFEFKNWSYNYNLQLLDSISDCKVHVIPANRKPLLPWFFSVLTEKICRVLDASIPVKGRILAQAISRRNNLTIKEVDKIKRSFDLVIGHNPGTLYAARYAAEKFSCTWGFDVEDYHPGESNNSKTNQRIIRYLKEHLPFANYLSFAAPLIRKETEKIIGTGKRHLTVLNYFPKEEFIPPEKLQDYEPLKLVWFSQNISFGRGLETIIPFIDQTSGIELYLIGYMNPEFESQYLLEKKNIVVHHPMPQADLHHMLSEFDVGLALEPGKDLNNELALSNKMLAYQQAGLYILASDTPAQREFLNGKKTSGEVLPEISYWKRCISELKSKKKEIRAGRNLRFESANEDNWENEKNKLLQLWNSLQR